MVINMRSATAWNTGRNIFFFYVVVGGECRSVRIVKRPCGFLYAAMFVVSHGVSPIR